jgi:cation diffusion facilitator CzcD-associated flavoprotein CzcO
MFVITEEDAVSAERTRNPHVAIVGAGMSGIYMAVLLQKAGFEFTILEKASDIGGTWRDNTYPGLVIDAPSRWYTYPFELNPEWTHFLAPGAEIFRYFDHVVSKYGLRRHIRFNTEVVNARFENNRWRLDTQDGEEVVADFVITATGVLHHPRYPTIKGLDSFSGPMFHSSRYDHSIPMADKRVAVIGTGSTGVQLVGALAYQVRHLKHFQRTPQWIMPLPNKKFSRFNRWIMRHSPTLNAKAHGFWRFVIGGMFSRALVEDGLQRKAISTACRLHLRTVRDPELRRSLTPNYLPMCKRMVMGTGFYAAVQRDNVEVITGDVIDHIEPAGIVTRDGTLHEVDVIVLATGFDGQAYIRPIKVTGLDGVTLDEIWGEVPKAYNTIALPNIPNFFMLQGPNNPLANQPLIDSATAQTGYVMQWLEMYRDGKFDLVSPTPEAAERFYEEIRSAFPGETIWTSGCTSWYIGSDGVPSVWPWRTAAYDELLRTPVIEDFDLQFVASEQPGSLR